MYCEVLHSEFIKDGHIECPFCNEKLVETKSIQQSSCEYPDLKIGSLRKTKLAVSLIKGSLKCQERMKLRE